MAEHYYNLQENEVVLNAPLHCGGRILYGSEAAVADVTTPTLLASSAHPSSHPHLSQPSMGKTKSRSNTFKDGRLKLYAEPPNPHDPAREKKRRKAVESFKNRQGSKLEFDALKHTAVKLEDEIGRLEMEKIRLQQNVDSLERDQQNWQYQAFDNTCPIPQQEYYQQQGDHYSSCPPNLDCQQTQYYQQQGDHYSSCPPNIDSQQNQHSLLFPY